MTQNQSKLTKLKMDTKQLQGIHGSTCTHHPNTFKHCGWYTHQPPAFTINMSPCEILGFRRNIKEIFALLRCYAA